jgi:hypothetical protein
MQGAYNESQNWILFSTISCGLKFICDCRQCPEMIIGRESWCVHICLDQISILDDAKIGVPDIVVINPNIHHVKIFILTTFRYLMDLQKQ